MSGLPEVTMTGTLVADPELKCLNSGDFVANFRIAANSRRYDRERGEWIDGDTTFLRCSIWRQAAENVAQSLTRGARVLVTGRLKQRSWETNEGEKRTAFELDVTDIGPSLKIATATVNKATRANGATASSEPDPWGSAPTEPTGATHASGEGEPPF